MDSPLCYQLPLFPPEKRCTKCGVCRPLANYTPDKRAADGLQKWCKPCRAVYYVAYRDGHRRRPDIPQGQKYCPYCQTLLSLDAFGFNRAHGDGHQSYCKDCRPRRYQEREKRPVLNPKPRGKRLALIPAEKRCPQCDGTKSCAMFYAVPNRPDGLAGVCRLCARATRRACFRRYRDRYVAAKKAYLAAHPTFNRDYLRRWYAANPTKNSAYHHSRRSREASAVRDLTAAQWRSHLEAIGRRCLRCGRAFSGDLPWTIDHIVPVSQGGGLTIDNVQALCKSCNSAKSTRTTDYRPQELR